LRVHLFFSPTPPFPLDQLWPESRPASPLSAGCVSAWLSSRSMPFQFFPLAFLNLAPIILAKPQSANIVSPKRCCHSPSRRSQSLVKGEFGSSKSLRLRTPSPRCKRTNQSSPLVPSGKCPRSSSCCSLEPSRYERPRYPVATPVP